MSESTIFDNKSDYRGRRPVKETLLLHAKQHDARASELRSLASAIAGWELGSNAEEAIWQLLVRTGKR